MSVSRVSFDPTKNYLEVQYNEDVPLLDSELNELQKIRRFFEMDANEKLLGASVLGDDWLILPSTSANSIVIKAGTFFYQGYQFVLYQDTTIGALTTPSTSRQDTVFVQYQEQVVDSFQDPHIIDPAVGSETTQRIGLVFQIVVAEGSAVPTPQAGFGYFQFGTLNRLGGQSQVTQAMIQDQRESQVHTYVLNGLQVLPGTGGPFNVKVNPGEARVAQQDIYLSASPSEFTLAPNTVTYLIFRTTELVEAVTTLPTTFQVILAQIVTNGSGVVTLLSQNGSTTADSLTLSGLGSTSTLATGQLVMGSGIPLGSYVTGIVDGATVTISQPTNDDTTETITFLGGISDMRSFQPLIFKSEVDAATPGLYESFMAGQLISIFSVVYLTSVANQVAIADNTTSATGPVVAIAISTVLAGNSGTFLTQGQITNTAWNWTLGLPIFLNTNGTMTQTVPLAPLSIIQEVARPITPTTIEFNPMDWVRN